MKYNSETSIYLSDQKDANLKALTVDDSGEFRLWNLPVKERGIISQHLSGLSNYILTIKLNKYK